MNKIRAKQMDPNLRRDKKTEIFYPKTEKISLDLIVGFFSQMKRFFRCFHILCHNHMSDTMDNECAHPSGLLHIHLSYFWDFDFLTIFEYFYFFNICL